MESDQSAELLIPQKVHVVEDQEAEQEYERPWTPAEMFAEVAGDRHLLLGDCRTSLKAKKGSLDISCAMTT